MLEKPGIEPVILPCPALLLITGGEVPFLMKG